METLPLVLLGVLLLLTIGLGIALIFRPGDRRLAQACGTLGLGVIALSSVATVSGLVLTFAAGAAPGLSQADLARMTSNGIAEALFSAVPGLFIGLPAVLLARRVRRQRG